MEGTLISVKVSSSEKRGTTARLTIDIPLASLTVDINEFVDKTLIIRIPDEKPA